MRPSASADIVIPKSWGCLDTMGTKPEESLRIAKQYRHWICDAAKMKLTRPDSLYMHPLPADRGNEVTDEIIDGPHSIVFTEAENRLHTAKAIMALTMADEPVTYEVRSKRQAVGSGNNVARTCFRSAAFTI